MKKSAQLSNAIISLISKNVYYLENRFDYIIENLIAALTRHFNRSVLHFSVDYLLPLFLPSFLYWQDHDCCQSRDCSIMQTRPSPRKHHLIKEEAESEHPAAARGWTWGFIVATRPLRKERTIKPGLSGHRTPFKLTLNIHVVATTIIATNPPLICGSVREGKRKEDANAA